MDTWGHAWVVLIIIFGGGLIVAKLTEKPRIPDVAAYLVLGILLGPYILNLVSEPAQSQVNQFIIKFGATLILFEGGLSVSISMLKKTWISIAMLATIGVVVSMVVVGVVAHYTLGGSWIFALLLASVIASIDPATLFPVFRRISIWPRLQQTVESESAFNDATASVFVITLMGLIGHSGAIQFGPPILDFFRSSIIGLAVGAAIGLLSLWLVASKKLGVFHELGSIVFLVAALGAYEAASGLNGSGYMAAFTAGIICGNGKTFHCPMAEHTQTNVHHFGNGMTLLSRMLIFVLLGTQVDFGVVYHYLWVGLLIVAVLMFAARPLSVLSCVKIDVNARWSWREILFMFWVRETGVIPAALSAMLLASSQVPHHMAEIINAITFLAILITILLQASTTGIVAKRLGIMEPTEETDI